MRLTAAALAAFLSFSAAAAAEPTEPLWEAGIGGGGFSGPTYPGPMTAPRSACLRPSSFTAASAYRRWRARAVAFVNETAEFDVSIGARWPPMLRKMRIAKACRIWISCSKSDRR